MLEFTPLRNLSIHLESLVKGRLWLQVIIGLIAGAALGVILNPSAGLFSEDFSSWLANWLDLPGQIFMRLVQMVMIPLIFASIVSGIVSNTSDNLKTFGLRLLLYFIFTTIISIIIGTVITLIMKPGQYVYSLGGLPNSGEELAIPIEENNLFENVPMAISKLIPNNPLESILMGEMLGIVIFTIIIGVAITQLNDKTAQPIIRFTEAVQKI